LLAIRSVDAAARVSRANRPRHCDFTSSWEVLRSIYAILNVCRID
jgi:hypothetical protein